MESQPTLKITGIEAYRDSPLYVTPASLPAGLAQQTSDKLFAAIQLWTDKAARQQLYGNAMQWSSAPHQPLHAPFDMLCLPVVPMLIGC